jgi:hypothetical protein
MRMAAGAERIGNVTGRSCRSKNPDGIVGKDGSQVEAISLLGVAQKLAGRTVAEMQPGAGLTDDGLVGALRIIRGIRQPMLYVQSGLRTFEDDVAHGGEHAVLTATDI